MELLLNNQDLFAESKADLGRSYIVKHKINTGENRPIKQLPRRMPMHKFNEAKDQVEQMLSTGVI